MPGLARKSRTCVAVLAAGMLASNLVRAQEPTRNDARSPAEAPLSLAGAIALALAANESLAAARLKVPFAGAAVDVARQRPNPDLTFETEKETPHDALTLALPIETAGKRGRRVRVAEAGVLTAEAELEQSSLAIRNEVRRAYYTLLAAQNRSSEAGELRGLAERIRAAADERFQVGAAPRLEVLQADLALAQTDNEVLAADASVAVARTELNVLLARRPDHETVIGGDLGADDVPEALAASEAALATSGELAVLDRRILEETARVDLAQAEQFPDPVLQGTFTHRSPPEFDYGWRAGLTVTLPVFHHRRAEVRVEERVLIQLQAERAAAASRIRGAVFSVAAVATAGRKQYLAYRDQMVPRADEVQRMAEDAYRSGQTNLVAMLQAIQAVRDVRARAIQAGLDYQVALADLERAMGAPLP